MSNCGISVVINVRLYGSQDALKMDAHKKTHPEFYLVNPWHVQWRELHLHAGQKWGASKQKLFLALILLMASFEKKTEKKTKTMCVEQVVVVVSLIASSGLVLLLVFDLMVVEGEVILHDCASTLLTLPEFLICWWTCQNNNLRLQILT